MSARAQERRVGVQARAALHAAPEADGVAAYKVKVH